jgi:hypothetical protein
MAGALALRGIHRYYLSGHGTQGPAALRMEVVAKCMAGIVRFALHQLHRVKAW